jgi:hypothetical protein
LVSPHGPKQHKQQKNHHNQLVSLNKLVKKPLRLRLVKAKVKMLKKTKRERRRVKKIRPQPLKEVMMVETNPPLPQQ